LRQRKLPNGELENLFFSPNIIKLIKEMRMKWVGQGAQMGEMKSVQPPLSYFYFDNSDVSHDIAQGSHKS
jgi:hypothetical protein